MKEKILIIRMLGLGDVTCIGIPAVRHIRKQFPHAELHALTYAAGEDILNLAEPSLRVHALKHGEWPENIVDAMQTFLGLAEIILGEEYTQIINLDTWFMPCFLARFLKDAGEPVIGNTMSIGVAELVDKFQNQTLSADYVNTPAQYMQSSWLSMEQWHTTWWEYGEPPERGYPEFYLRRCCGFSAIDMDFSIPVEADKRLSAVDRPVVALATNARTKERHYPYGDALQVQLEKAGCEVWTGFDGRCSMAQTLAQLKASALLVTVPSAPQWLAATVGTPSLVISGEVDPRTLMPDYATDMSAEPVSSEAIVAGVLSILEERNHA
ncbi:glycosyltransferase family 9 protein [Aestuariibacter sp. A3R04]|uniref:glycosyltransferase family 9 protein n=1 Tax=Aestuariibacter sp. A3R04 TaxID=2841571 RepID=UPI00209020DD|nr:hypothetical protein [Aestuariibacter sp. A3R04]